MKLWAGRFSKEADERVNDFNSSIRFDSRMYAHDIKGSMAHAQMLGAQGIIPRADADAIWDGLDSICGDLQSGALLFDPQAEDIHMFIEQEMCIRDRFKTAGPQSRTRCFYQTRHWETL